jgi:hypothetical protein
VNTNTQLPISLNICHFVTITIAFFIKKIQTMWALWIMCFYLWSRSIKSDEGQHITEITKIRWRPSVNDYFIQHCVL